MRWPWTRNRELEQAKQEQERAENRQREVQPLVRQLNQHDRVNHFGSRFRAALGGDK